MPPSKTVAVHTLGCKLNYAESSSISRMLEHDGYTRKDFSEVADIYIINTCSVTANADKECRQIVRRIQRAAPGSTIVVTGCYAQLRPEEISSIPGVDLVLGAAEKFNISQHLKLLTKGDPSKICSCDIDDVKDFNAAYSFNGRTRTFLKVQDGCNYNCAFCTIPLARGKSRSDRIENVLGKVDELGAAGVKEIVLTGINLGDFNSPFFSISQNDLQENAERKDTNFYSLLAALDASSPVMRYRISSIEPNLLSNEIIHLVANSKKIMPHFHIPLQSGSNKILGAMRRRYRKELYAEKVALIKMLMPHCAIGADVIVGFPGESEDDFNETFEFLSKLDVSYLHVFTYSERSDTIALQIKPVVPVPVRNARNRMLRNLSYEKMKNFTHQHGGQKRKVLFEQRNKYGMMEGYTDNYIKLEVPYQANLVNQVVEWQI
ncbi:MAG: tRNA (N(6)-L-threonylcarbamoyladenosine(37)-C(2))-methylthiotransferase MtaB [Ginsengibacter sp.]